MIAAQLAFSFLIWVGSGFVKTRRVHDRGTRVAQLPRGLRAFLGAFLLIASAAVLFGTLAWLQDQKALDGTSIPPGFWALVTLAGLVFVEAQAYAATMMITLIKGDVTSDSAQASAKQDNDEN